MEVLLNSLNSKGATLETDQSLRLPSRPVSKQGSAHLLGLTHEDLGASLDPIRTTQASKKRREPGRRTKESIFDDIVDSESEDEIDMLSHHDSDTDTRSVAKETRKGNRGYTDSNGKVHEYHPDYTPTKTRALAKLKFKKTKTTMTSQGSEPSTSQIKANHDSVTVRGRGSGLSPQGSRVRDKRAENVPMSPKKPPPPRQRKPIPMVPEPTQSQPRPKPRPIPPRSATSSSVKPGPAPFPSIDSPMHSDAPPRKPIQKTYGKAAASSPKKSNRAVAIKKPQIRSIKKPTFNSSSASSSCTSRSTSPYSPVQSTKLIQPNPFPVSSPLSSPVRPQGFPSLSPVGSPTPTKHRATATLHSRKVRHTGKSDAKAETRPKPRPSKRQIIESDASDDVRTKAQPFPMGTPLQHTAGSPGPSRPSKHSSTARNHGVTVTRRGADAIIAAARAAEIEFERDDETLFISPSTDPRTLCPYCDSPLPASPSPLLTKLLATTAKRSYRDPRPANPLGRRAPVSVFIDVCQRHRFESQILPQAEAQGWPKTIDWAALGHRVEGMQESLRGLIDDAGPDSGTDPGPRSRCQFWNEIVREVKAKGSRAVIGVRGQFLTFEKTQPGYYGELGSVIIHQTLYNLFPPASLDAKRLAPLTAPEFIQRVLVPEVGARLIMDDMKLRGASGMAEAVRILRESAAYGVAMFPEDGNRPDGGRDHDTEDKDGMDVADRIMMERAKKRRKELEEEEAKEMEQEEQAKTARKNEDGGSKAESKGKSKSKASVTPSDTDNDVSGPEPRLPQKPRRPKAHKADLMSEADLSDAPRRSQRNQDKNRGDHTDSKPPTHNPKTRASQTSTATSGSDIEPGVGSFSNKRKVRPGSSLPDVNLCSDEDNVATAGRPRKKKHVSASREPEVVSSTAAAEEGSTTSTRRAADDTKSSRTNPTDREAGDDTPRAMSKMHPQTSDSSLFPLRRAREQVAANKKPLASGSGGKSSDWITSMRVDPVDDGPDGDSAGWARTSSESGSSSSRAHSYSWLLSDTPTPSR